MQTEFRTLALRVAGTAFGLFALAHVVRLMARTEVRVGSRDVPLAGSIAGALVGSALSAWMWDLSNESDSE